MSRLDSKQKMLIEKGSKIEVGFNYVVKPSKMKYLYSFCSARSNSENSKIGNIRY